jgi:SAM-dependent methyltransferase
MPIKEEIVCPICEHKDYTRINTAGRDYFRTYLAICKNCGLAYQNPRWSKESILKFYQESYDKYYRPTFLKQDLSLEEYELYKWGFNPLLNRIAPFLNKKEGLNILDIGSGEGTNLKYLGHKLPNSDLFAIEPSHDALSSLTEKKITVLSNDVDSDWHLSANKKFDIVTLRHVFEHLQFPNEFLKKVKTVLKDNGLLYIAVPDTYNVGTLVFSRDFSRIVHNYYFTKKSLTNIIHKNGLKVLSMKEGDEQHDAELFAVVALSDSSMKMDILPTEHDKQLSYLQPYIDRDSKFMYQFIDFKDYVLRRIYPRKIKIKKALGLIKSRYGTNSKTKL